MHLPFFRHIGLPMLLSAVALALPLASQARAATLTVTTVSDGANDGTCSSIETGDGCTLREAITEANRNADQTDIVFAPGVSGTVEIQQPLPTLATNLSINGSALGGIVLMRGSATNAGYVPPFSVLSIASGAQVTLQNLTLTRGYSEGGAIFNNGTLTLNSCVLTNNSSPARAGGLYNNGIATLNFCSFLNNSANGIGGGSRNAFRGGGVYNSSVGNLLVQSCTFVGNTANGTGGGLNNMGGTMTVRDSTFSGNSAGEGGGGVYSEGTGTFERCTLSENGKGGMLTGGSHALSNCLIVGNQDYDFIDVGTPTSQGYNLIGTGGTGPFTQPGDKVGVTAAQVNLGPLQNNGGAVATRAIGTDSLAYNAGDPGVSDSPTSFDGRGAPYSRVGAGRLDVGAYEYQSVSQPSLVVTTLLDEDDSTSDPNVGNGTSLREAINYANSDPDGSNITFAAGLAGGTIALKSALPALTTQLSILNPAATNITLDGGAQNFRVLTVGSETGGNTSASPTVGLAGLTLTGGQGTSGGGLANFGGIVRLERCTISGNAAAVNGGGVFSASGALSLVDSTVANNNAVSGGGACLAGGTLTFASGALYGNVGSQDGGGVSVAGGTATLLNASVFANVSVAGGGVLNKGGATSVRNCTITSNGSLSGVGAGVSNSGGSFTLGSSIVASNNGTDVDAPSSSNAFQSEGFNLAGTSRTGALAAFTGEGDQTGVTSAQLRLGSAQNNGGPTLTFAIGTDSIAFNAGSGAAQSLPAFDQRGAGYARVSGGRADVGAYEVQVRTVSGTVYNAVALTGLNNITVRALDANGVEVARALTNVQGQYSLPLPEGQAYTLVAGKPEDASYFVAPLFNNPVTVPGYDLPNYNFRAVGIGGRIISPSNVGISGVTVNLYARNDTAQATPLRSSVTDAQGFFSLDGVAQGTWLVAPVAQPSLAFTPPSRLITVFDRAVFTSFTASARQSVVGTVYNAVALKGLGGITVSAFRIGTSTVAAQAVTDAQGKYTLSLVPGTYNLSAIRVGDGITRFLPLFTNPITTKATSTTCEFRAVGIGGRVISPTNAGIAGVTVNLYSQDDTTRATPLRTSVTDAQGFFSLDGVAAGTWLVAPVAPTTYAYTPATRLVAVGNASVFTSFQAKAKPASATRSSSAGARSDVALSSASADATAGTLTLRFTGVLDASSAAELNHYGLQVNGEWVNVQGAHLSNGGDTLVLSLPTGALINGSQVLIGWSGVLDAQGLVLQGQTPVSAS